MIIAAGPFLAGEPGAREIADGAVGVVEDVLAEVPDGAVGGLGVEVERDLLDAPVQIGDVLGDERLDALARAPFDDPGAGQERGLGPERLPGDRAVQDDRVELADREERVGDPGGVGEGSRDQVDPAPLGRQRELVQPGRLQVGRGRLRDPLGDAGIAPRGPAGRRRPARPRLDPASGGRGDQGDREADAEHGGGPTRCHGAREAGRLDLVLPRHLRTSSRRRRKRNIPGGG
jgi:hypothetical protein